MNDYLENVRRDGRHARKLLQFGADRLACADCVKTDIRCLCRPGTKGRSTLRPILCRNCLCKREVISPRSIASKRKQFEIAGYADPACVVCREPDLRVLELDHVAGRANGTLLAPLCANCHDIKSDIANDPPMAVLRSPDPDRSALVLQAAFEFGLAAILGLYAVVDVRGGEATRPIFFGLAAALLVAWALWNLSADEHFTKILGPRYDKGIPAEVPS